MADPKPSPPQTPAPGKRRRLRKFSLLLLLLAVIAGVSHPLWLAPLATRSLPYLASRFADLDLQIEVVELGLDGIEVRNLQVQQRGEAPVLVELAATSLSAEFSLRALLGGDFTALSRVEARALRLDLRLDRLPESEEPTTDSEPTSLSLPERLPLLDIETESLALTLPGAVQLLAQGAHFNADADSRFELGELIVNGDAYAESWSTRPLTLKGKWQASIIEELELAVAEGQVVRPSRADLRRVLDGEVALDLRLGFGTADSQLKATLNGEGAEYDLNLEALELGVLNARSPIELPLALHGSLDLESAGKVSWEHLEDFEARADFTLTRFEAAGRSVAHCSGHAELAAGWLTMPQLDLRQERNSLHLTELRWPLLASESKAWLSESSARLQLAVKDLAAITGPLELPERYKRLPAHELSIVAEVRDGNVEVSKGVLDTSGGHVEITRALITRAEVTTGGTWRDPWRLELRSRADIRHLDQVGLLFGQSDWWGRLDGELDVQGTWPKLEGTWNVNGRNLRIGAADIGALSLALEADGEELELKSLRASGRGISLDASGRYVLDEASIEDGVLSLELPQLADWAPQTFTQGSLRVDALLAGPLSELRAQSTLGVANLAVRGVAVEDARVELSGHGRSWRCESLHGVTDLGVLDAAFELELNEAWRLEHATISSLQLVRGAEGLRLDAPASFELMHDDQGVSGSWSALTLVGEAGELDSAANFSPTHLELDVKAIALRPDVFLDGTAIELPRLAQADGSAHIEGEWSALRYESTGVLQQLRIPGAKIPSDLSWSLTHDGSVLTINELNLTGAEQVSLRASGALPVVAMLENTTGEVSMDFALKFPLSELAGISGAEGASASAGTFEASGHLSGSLDELAGSLTISGEDLRWSSDLHPPEVGDGKLSGTLTIDEGLRVEDFEVKLGELVDVLVDAHLETPTSLRLLMADAQQFLDNARLKALLEVGALDLEALSRAFGELAPDLQRLRRGSVSGELDVSGPLRSPELAGTLRVEDATLRLGSGLPTADRLQAELGLAGSSFEIHTLTGELGGAPFELSGNADLAGAETEVDFKLTGEDLLLFRNREARLRGDADLALVGPLNALAVAGSLDLSDSRFAPDTEFLNLRGSSKSRGARGFQIFHLREAPLSNMSFDITLTSSQSLIIRNTVVNGGARANLHLGGTGLLPVLTGRVYLDRTLMRLPASSLELTGGTILFHESDPFMPEVEINGRTRILGYDVKASISGLYDSPEILLSSTPPLSQENLLLLVLTGRLPDDPDQTDPLATANTVALYLARDSLARWFTDDGPMNEDSLFNRFEFATGQDVSRNGVETVNIAYRLTDKEGLPQERRDRKHIYLAGERDRFEDYNYGLRLVFRLRR